MDACGRWSLVVGLLSLSLGAACFTPADEVLDAGLPLGPEPVTPALCVVGTVTQLGGPTALSLFGDPVFFEGGAALPAGTYRLQNNGGCMRYGPGQNWTTNAYANGDVSWWIIGSTTSARLLIPPGTVGFERIPGSVDRDVGSFSDFAQCDLANQALPVRDFTFPGGQMGIWLKDDIYGDNSSGESGKNPSWTLSRVTRECP